MSVYIIKRVASSVVLFWLVTVVTFVLVRQAPGGPEALVRSNSGADSGGESLGLTGSIWDQYGVWFLGLFRGDLGISYDQSVHVVAMIQERLPNTLILSAAGLIVGSLIGIALGALGALRQGGVADALGRTLGVAGVAVPQFWLGIVLILVFSVGLGWLPPSDMYSPGGSGLIDLLRHLILPATVVAMFVVANILRFTRTSVIATLREPYLVTASAKGLRRGRILSHHILRNSLLPIITVIGLSVPRVVGGAAITEVVFNWPGVGSMAVTAAKSSDYPVIMGVTLVLAAIVIVVNLITDLSYHVIDPRIRLGEGSSR